MDKSVVETSAEHPLVGHLHRLEAVVDEGELNLPGHAVLRAPLDLGPPLNALALARQGDCSDGIKQAGDTTRPLRQWKNSQHIGLDLPGQSVERPHEIEDHRLGNDRGWSVALIIARWPLGPIVRRAYELQRAVDLVMAVLIKRCVFE